MFNMFGKSLSGNASPEIMAVAKASVEALNGNQLSIVCKYYNVDERDVIKFIVEKTEYETVLDLQRQKEAQDNPDITVTEVKGGAIYERRK
tara:strand:+ start:68 stop:340 length:273 start_codon:yes stop_codon:yes gene_type:complete